MQKKSNVEKSSGEKNKKQRRVNRRRNP